MNHQEKAQNVFKPLLQNFCNETMHLQMDDNFSTLFLPHTMDEYADAKRKIFYFGRDTNSGCKTALLRQYYESNQLEKYMEDNSAFLREHEYLFYNNNASVGFWTLVVNLHLRMKGIKHPVKVDASFYDSEYLELMNDFGYGNTNAIEVKESLQNQGLWNSLDIPKYLVIKEKSTQLDKLKHTLDAYHPDLVFIFNWATDHEKFLDGLRYTLQKTNLVRGHLWVITLLDYNTQIIWTLHPRGLPYNHLNVHKFIEIITTHVLF